MDESDVSDELVRKADDYGDSADFYYSIGDEEQARLYELKAQMLFTTSPRVVREYQRQVDKVEGRRRLCFVATAAAGSSDSPLLEPLHDLRDSILAESKPGRRLIVLYYRVGPRIAAWTCQSPLTRGLVLVCVVIPASILARLVLTVRGMLGGR